MSSSFLFLVIYIAIGVAVAWFLHNSRVPGLPKLGDRNDNYLLVVGISLCWPIVMCAAIIELLFTTAKALFTRK